MSLAVFHLFDCVYSRIKNRTLRLAIAVIVSGVLASAQFSNFTENVMIEAFGGLDNIIEDISEDDRNRRKYRYLLQTNIVLVASIHSTPSQRE